MKKFHYRWRSGRKEFTGDFICQDEEALKEHIRQLKGTLTKVIFIEEVAEDAIIPEEKTERKGKRARKVILPDATKIKRGPLRKLIDFDEDLMVLQICAWLTIVISAVFSGFLIVGGLIDIFGGDILSTAEDLILSLLGRTVPYLVLLLILMMVCCLGVIALIFPGVGLLLLTVASLLNLVPSIARLLQGNILYIIWSGLCGSLFAYGIYQLKRVFTTEV